MKLIGLLASLVLLCAFAGCKWCSCSQCPCCQDHGKEENVANKEHSSHAEPVIDIKNTQDFDEKVLHATKPVIVDFSASWCGACQTMKPIFHDLAHKLSDKYEFVTVDVDANAELAEKYQIRGIPTFLLFEAGKQVGQPLVGAVSAPTMQAALEKNFGK